MVEIELNGKKVEVAEGSNLIAAAAAHGTYIPHFCYHKKLSIAANCRMCLVEIEKMPKPMPACATNVAPGMVVKTHSEKAVAAQKSVMEFLLINHPLDCPVCDQGGECQLQDLAVGYGEGNSRYTEEKRVVGSKDVGPLISMEEMSRCIQCTRCVRFGQEVAGVMELGMINRGEHSEITTFENNTIDSEISGNMIDICPVGALTSKPFRFAARSWELSRRRSISPHDSSGANLIVQVKSNQVLRVLPLENEAVNECWIADRERFSYEALQSSERLQTPMLKQDGKWMQTDWQTAIEYVASGLNHIRQNFGAHALGLLASPHATLEELYLAQKLMRALGSDNIDHRLRHAQFVVNPGVRWLGRSVASLSQLDCALVVGSNLRKHHPLFAQRIRQSANKGAQIMRLVASEHDWAMPLAQSLQVPTELWLAAMAQLAHAVARAANCAPPAFDDGAQLLKSKQLLGDEHVALYALIAENLLSSNQKEKAILLGNAVAHHGQAEQMLAVVQWIGKITGASVGFLTEAANTLGAQYVGAWPHSSGMNAKSMLESTNNTDLRAVLLLNTEPQLDSAYGSAGLKNAQMVVSLNPFAANMDVADVMLPIAPFTETAGSFINAQGMLQSFYAAVQPFAQAKPAWKVLRVLANTLDISGFEYESTQQVLTEALGQDVADGVNPAIDAKLNNNSSLAAEEVQIQEWEGAAPCVAAIYQLDGLVRRSTSLQATADARNNAGGQV